jgi:hypothetical protein
MRLVGASGCMSIQSEDKTIDRTIEWQLQENDTPRLVGIKSNGRRSIYLEVPILCLPPIPLSYESSHEFDAQIIEIQGLWNLEQVSLIMTNGTDGDICHYTQADREGNLKIRYFS